MSALAGNSLVASVLSDSVEFLYDSGTNLHQLVKQIFSGVWFQRQNKA